MIKLYYSNGKLNNITNVKQLKDSVGYTLYNQDISKDKNWGETKKRTGLKIITIKESIGSKIEVAIAIFHNGYYKSKDYLMQPKGLVRLLKGLDNV